MEAEEEIVQPVRNSLRQLSSIEKKCKTALKDCLLLLLLLLLFLLLLLLL